MQPPQTRYAVRADEVSIAYQVVGEGPIDLLFAPGFISHLDLWWTDPSLTRFLQRLSSFSRLILYDKPGTGLSDPITHVPTLEERRDDIRIVLDAAGSERSALIGFSEGAPACALLAATDPGRVSSLILYGAIARSIASMMEDDSEEARRSLRTFERMRTDLLENWGQGKILDYFAPSVAGPIQRRFWGTFERAAASPRMVRILFQTILQIDLTGALEAISAPTLVLHHDDDIIPVLHAHYLVKHIPHAELRIMPGRDHAFWAGDFAEPLAEIERFLTGSTTGGVPTRALTTVLFTDIVGSTGRAAELGDREWRQLLERHDQIVAEHVAAGGGRVVKSLGDGTLAIFDGPARAIAAAGAMRDELERIGIPIRAGVHTGECELIGEDIGGMAVHIGARVGGMAGPGEILVSSTVADLVVGSGLRFADRGEHELKGVPGRWRLLAVDSPAGDRVEVPAERPARPRISDRIALTVARRAPQAMRAAARVTRRVESPSR